MTVITYTIVLVMFVRGSTVQSRGGSTAEEVGHA